MGAGVTNVGVAGCAPARKISILISRDAGVGRCLGSQPREKAVNDALRGARMTRIVVAHRPETIRASDRIVSLIDGEIAGGGTPKVVTAT